MGSADCLPAASTQGARLNRWSRSDRSSPRAGTLKSTNMVPAGFSDCPEMAAPWWPKPTSCASSASAVIPCLASSTLAGDTWSWTGWMDRLDGPTMLKLALTHPHRIGFYGHLLAQLHTQLHQIVAPHWLITEAAVRGDCLLHRDLHPLNVL
jgi:hypothetical protein